MKKWQFIEDELVASSIRGALQRAKVYAHSTDSPERDRKRLRQSLAILLRDLARRYSTRVTPEAHGRNIQRIADFLTAEFRNKNVLRGDKFRIGVAQKALNLYLKYLWCLGKAETPPHCPFDSRIIAKLPLTEQQRKNLRWTELNSTSDYQTLVAAGLQKIGTTGHSSLSEWELEAFNALR
jgi:hypothetical protein